MPFAFYNYNHYFLGESGQVDWRAEWVRLTSPTEEQCHEVIDKLTDNHRHVVLWESSPAIVKLLAPTVLQRKTVKELLIACTPIGNESMILMSSLLSTNNSLSVLSLRSCSISDLDVDVLVKALKCNIKLTELSLSDNSGITSNSAQSLVDLFLTNHTLLHVSLWHTSIDTDGVILLVNALKVNKTLKTLKLNKEHEQTCSSLPFYDLISQRLHFTN